MNRPEVAFIFAAGRGERLRPLTDKTPKPLLPIQGKPILDHILDSLAPLKLKKIVFNAWHLGDQIEDYVAARAKNLPCEMVVSRESELLGTGGGLKKALPLLGTDSFLMLNGDCLWKGDVAGFIERADRTKIMATWWLRPIEAEQTKIQIQGSRITGIGSLWGEKKGEKEGCFTGIQWVRKIHADRLPDKGCIVRQYWIPLLQEGHSLGADFSGLEDWIDIGTVDRYSSQSG